MKRSAIILFASVCSAFAQPPPSGGNNVPVYVDANGNFVPATRNGHHVGVNAYPANLTQIPTRNFVDLQNKPTTLAGYGITDGLSSVPVSRTVFVDVNGNNTTAVAGDLTKPALTIARAITLASGLTPSAANPVVINVGPGTFTENTGVTLPNYVSLVGAGRTATTIQSSLSSTGNCAAIVNPGSYSVVGYLKIQATGIGSGLFAFPIGAGNPGTAFTGVILRGLTVVGDTDAVYVHATVTNSDLVAYDCILQSKWDSVYVPAGSSADFYDCQSLVVGQAAESTAAPTHGLNDAGGNVRWFGGVIQAQGSTAPGIANIAINATSSSTLEVYHAKIIRPTATASWDFQAISPATIVYGGLVRADGAALIVSSFNSGTLSEASRYAVRDNNLSDVASASAARANLGLAIGSNVQAWDQDLDSIAAISGTGVIPYRSAANTWGTITIGTGLTFSGGTLASTGGAGTGDFSSNTSLSVANEIVLFADTTGKLGKRSTLTGVPKLASGVMSASGAKTIDLGDFNSSAATSDGQIPMWDTASSTYIPGDPKVQGLVAEGSTTATNPVNVGGYNTAGTPAIHGANVINGTPAGTEYGVVTRPIPNGTQTVSGTVTANAGTNLNTSLLALEGGGNLATIAGAVSSSKMATKSADGDFVTLGAKADAKSTATDTTAITAMQALKEISFMEQNPATQAVSQSGAPWSMTISGTPAVTISGTPSVTIAQSNITTDYDTGAGTQTMTMFGLALPASGGAVAGGTATNPIQVSVANTGANTNKLLVTPDSVALPLHQSVNVDQVNGTATDTNSGNKSAGTQRVVIATDQPQLTNKLLVTPDANSAVNVSQMNGVTVTMGNGIAGTGVQRVAVASDNTAFSVNPLSATAPVVTMNSASANSGLNSALAGVFDDVAPTAITENNFGFLRMSANRNLYGTIRDGAGNERGANVNATNQLSVSVDNTAAVNHTQLAGTAVDVNSGTKSAGTQRVVLATDQPALTNAQPSNVTQIGGSSVGTAAAGVQKVGVVGNAGATIDAAMSATTAPTNGIGVLQQYNSTLPSPTTGQSVPFQANSRGEQMQVGGGYAILASANFTRPADTTAYAANDLVANSTTAASVTPLSFTAARYNDASGMVRRAKLKKSTTTTTNAKFQLYLYQNDPSASTGISNGDNGAFSTKEAAFLGTLSCDMTGSSGQAFSDAADAVCTPDSGSEINFAPKAGTQTIYGLLKATAAYTPGNAEVFTVQIEVLQN